MGEEQVFVAVAIEIGLRTATAHDRREQGAARLFGPHRHEARSTGIPKQLGRLTVLLAGLDLGDFFLQMAVDADQVEAPIEVPVEEHHAKLQRQTAGGTHAPGDGLIGEETRCGAADVEGRHFIGEVTDGDAQLAVVGESCGVDAHGPTRVAVAVEGDARQGSDLLEVAVALVLEDEVLDRVIGHDEVGEPVGVEIHGHHAEGLGRGHPSGWISHLHAALLANVGEAPAAVVAVQVRERSLKIHGRPVGSGGSIDLVAHLGVNGSGPVHVAGHEHVEVAVIVEVEPRGRGAPLVRTAADPGRCGNILEVSATLIVKEVSPAHGGDQHVGIAVVVVVTDGGTHAVERRLEAGSG